MAEEERLSQSLEDIIRIKIPKAKTLEGYVVRTEKNELLIVTKEQLEKMQEKKEKK